MGEPKQDRQSFQALLNDIQYKDWAIKLGQNEDDGYFYLQVLFDAPHNRTGEMMTQRCRKWQLSVFMCDTEVVRTAHMAIQAAELHEVDEYFKYKDQLIFCPHIDVNTLVEVAQNGNLDLRDDDK